jgi:hypothetical protein
MSPHRCFVFGPAVALLALAGCSDPYAGQMEVTGTVKLKGQPLKEGMILFVPLNEQGTDRGNQSTESGAMIVDGEYKIPREKGLKPGKYLVRITSGDGKTPSNEEAGNPGGSTNIVSVDRIPPEWNTQSDQKVEVKSSGPNKFDYDIPREIIPKKR